MRPVTYMLDRKKRTEKKLDQQKNPQKSDSQRRQEREETDGDR